MLTLEEVRNFLEIEQIQIEKFLQDGKLKAYKIGGTYIRFRKEEVLNLRFEMMPQKTKLPKRNSFGGNLAEFWRFNNFYILSILVVAAIVTYFLKT